jgi:hypothetical protein
VTIRASRRRWQVAACRPVPSTPPRHEAFHAGVGMHWCCRYAAACVRPGPAQLARTNRRGANVVVP